ncbi:3'-5' exoribonuclease [Paenibacillus sp. 1182]|uniref:metal-dependent phosphohydrolase n=1 Tax=Paenibacillus sp. 1182 TaxID=2806565 RepID=UPI001AEAF961|nr:metal-dependent phosphohydrolase [Paenibacillus sp. 1182]MBP1308688.1 3'-5' exoribonuclease [Paenibacillus sp. 1182]
MKTKIKDLQKGQEAIIEGTIIKDKKYKKTNNEEPWIHLKVTDQSRSSAYAKIWNELELYPVIDEMEDGMYIEANVKCTQSDEFIHIEVHSIQVVERKTHEMVDSEGLKEELRGAISEIKDLKLKKLLHLVFARPEINEAYFKAPAAMMSGYSFEGGALAYVVRSIRLVKAVASVFNEWNHHTDGIVAKLSEDLLTTACILEAVGRTKSFRMNGVRVEKTTEGEMFEDAYLTLKVIWEEIGKLNFSDEQRLMLEHVIGSSKGRSEWGALHVPRSREAVAFGIILNLNFQMGNFEYLERHAGAEDQFAKLFKKQMYLGTYV